MEIATHFSYFISKGVVITLNGAVIHPEVSLTRFSKDFSNKMESIAPYVYKHDIDGVSVEVTIGFYRSLSSETEEEDERDGKSVSTRAGITIICNDRVVLHNDKTHITGWGEAGVPRYHTQFIGISGVVIFKSNNPSKLPLKTTKRGVDSDSQVYALVKDKMREGIKIFTDFTNKWKKSTKTELSLCFPIDKMDYAPSVDLLNMVQSGDWHTLRRGGQVFKPNLPMPKEEDPVAKVVFTKKRSEIDAVSEYIFEELKPPAEVGEYCFDQMLKRV
jgi:hypothetical protein